jgi:hypothetical protein
MGLRPPSAGSGGLPSGGSRGQQVAKDASGAAVWVDPPIADQKGRAAGIEFPLSILSEPPANDANPYAGYPATCTNVKGELVVVYSRGPNNTLTSGGAYVLPAKLYAKRSSDGGRTWTDEAVVVDRTGAGEPRDPVLYRAPGERRIYLTSFLKKWTPADTSYSNVELDIYYSDDDGVTFQGPVVAFGTGYVAADAPRKCLDGVWRWPIYHNEAGGYVARLAVCSGDPVTGTWTSTTTPRATAGNSAEWDFIEIDRLNWVAVIRGTISTNFWVSATHDAGATWDTAVQVTNAQLYDGWPTLRRADDGSLLLFIRGTGGTGGGLRVLRCTTIGQYAVQNIAATGATAGTFTLTVTIPSGPLAGTYTTAGIAFNATAATVRSAIITAIGGGALTSDIDAVSGTLPASIQLVFRGQLGGMTIAAMTADSTGLTGGTAVVTQQQPGLPVGAGAVSATAWTEPNGIRGGLWRALDWDNNGNHNFAHFKPVKIGDSWVGAYYGENGPTAAPQSMGRVMFGRIRESQLLGGATGTTSSQTMSSTTTASMPGGVEAIKVRGPGFFDARWALRTVSPATPINATWTVRITDPYGNVASVAASTPLEGVISGGSEVASTGYRYSGADELDLSIPGEYTLELVGSVASGSRTLSWRKFRVRPV